MPYPAHIIGIVGNLGSGKTLLATVCALYDLEVMGKHVYANYKIKYTTPDGRSVKYTDVSQLAYALQTNKLKHAPNTALLVIDEAYLGLDSRASNTAWNRLMSYFILQSRKLGFDIIFVSQFASAVEKRLRNLADVWVLAEAMKEVNEEGEEVENFYYTMVSRDTVAYFTIPYESAKLVFPTYQSWQVVKPPIASISKEKAKEIETEIQKKTLSETSHLKDAIEMVGG